PIVIVQPVEQDQETFAARNFTSTESNGVIGPIRVTRGSAAVNGRKKGLLIKPGVSTPETVVYAPTIRARIDEITLIKSHAITGNNDIGVLHEGVPGTEPNFAVRRRIRWCGRNGNTRGQDHIAAILGKEALHVMRRSAK